MSLYNAGYNYLNDPLIVKLIFLFRCSACGCNFFFHF